MTTLIIMILAFSLTACSGGGEKPVPLDRYENILTAEDIRTVVKYTGEIEMTSNIDPEFGVHFSFGTEGYVSPKEGGHPIIDVHVERILPDKGQLAADMEDRDPIANIGSQAWYKKADDSYHSLIFYVKEGSILVELGAHSSGSKLVPSAQIDKEGLKQLARLIEGRL